MRPNPEKGKLSAFVDKNLKDMDGKYIIKRLEEDYNYTLENISIQDLLRDRAENNQVSYLIRSGENISVLHKSKPIRPPVQVLITTSIQYLEHDQRIHYEQVPENEWLEDQIKGISKKSLVDCIKRYANAYRSKTQLGLIYYLDFRPN